MESKTKYLIGTSGWTYEAWRHVFYPKELTQSKWLEYYAEHFPIVELNATYYQFFKKQNFIDWHDRVPKKFRFVVKIPRLITHYKRLLNADNKIKQFCNLAEHLQEKLELYLLQLPLNIPYHPERLRMTLKAFDDPKKVVVEFRNPIWLTREAKDLLSEFKCVFCTPDSPETKLLNWLTAKKGYIRLHGKKRWYNYRYSNQELQQVARFAKRLAQRGARTIYVFFNNDYAGYAVENAMYLQTLLKSATKK